MKRKLEDLGHGTDNVRHKVCQCDFCLGEIAKGRTLDEADDVFVCDCGEVKNAFILTAKNKHFVYDKSICLECLVDERDDLKEEFAGVRLKFAITFGQLHGYHHFEGSTTAERLPLRVKNILDDLLNKGKDIVDRLEGVTLAPMEITINERGEFLFNGRPHA